MKVVLIKDVAGVGQKGTIKNVSDGYATNYLIPRKLAEMANSEKIAALRRAADLDAEDAKRKDALWDAYAARLSGAHVTVRYEANEKGQLYRQVLPSAIAERLSKELGVEVPADTIIVNAPIKRVGKSSVTIRLGSQKRELQVFVEKDEVRAR